MKISVVIPTFNEAENVRTIFSSVSTELNKISNGDYEVIFVDDGSMDRTLDTIKNLASEKKNVKFISLSRNFGKDAAIVAGLEFSKGDHVLIADADMQDPITMIPDMYCMIISSDYDCIGVRRISRKGEPLIRSYFARLFYKLAKRFFSVDIVDGVRDFRIMTRTMVNSVLRLNEKNRFTKGIFAWVGFKTKYLEYENIKRVQGETKWSFGSLVNYAIDAIWDFSSIPFLLMFALGVMFFLLAVTLLIFTMVSDYVLSQPVFITYSLLFFVLFFTSIQLFAFAAVIKYLSKMYIEVKSRPLYIVKESN